MFITQCLNFPVLANTHYGIKYSFIWGQRCTKQSKEIVCIAQHLHGGPNSNKFMEVIGKMLCSLPNTEGRVLLA